MATAAALLAAVATGDVPGAGKYCVADAAKGEGSAVTATDAVCDMKDKGYWDCTAIRDYTRSGYPYWPNGAFHHANWAFQQLYLNDGPYNDTVCEKKVPNSAAKVVQCDGKCTKCGMKSGSSQQDADDVIGYLCNSTPAVLGPLCDPIKPGNVWPVFKDDVERASFVMNIYYEPLSCSNPAQGTQGSCEFGGKGVVTDC